MKSILSIAHKDLRLLLRDRPGFFFTFFWPLLIAMFFGSIFSGASSGPREIALLYVDRDRSETSRAFLQTLDDSEELRLVESDLQEANERVRRGQSVAYIVIPSGYGEAADNPFFGGAPTVQFGSDPARRAETGLIQGVLVKYAAEQMQTFFTDSSRARESARSAREQIEQGPAFEGSESVAGFLDSLDLLMSALPSDTLFSSSSFGGFVPLEIEEIAVERERPPGAAPPNGFSISFPQGMLWGIIGSTAAFGISLVSERTKGTLVRLRMAPLGARHILGGKAVACLVTALGMTFVLVAVGRLFFDVRPLSYGKLSIALLCSALCFVGIMMLLSVLGKTEQAAAGIGWAILLVMSMIGGAMVPLFIMPSWLRSASDASPVKWAILAIEGALWRGFSWREMLLPCTILIGFGLFFFLIGVRAFRWSQQQ